MGSHIPGPKVQDAKKYKALQAYTKLQQLQDYTSKLQQSKKLSSKRVFNALSILAACNVAYEVHRNCPTPIAGVDVTKSLPDVFAELGDPNVNLFLFKGKLNAHNNMNGMLDTGATQLFITRQAAEKAQATIRTRPQGGLKVKCANGNIEVCTEIAEITLKLNGYSRKLLFIVTPFAMAVDFILGTPFINTLDGGDITMHGATGSFSFRQKGREVTVPHLHDTRDANKENHAHFQVISAEQGWHDVKENMANDPDNAPAIFFNLYPKDFVDESGKTLDGAPLRKAFDAAMTRAEKLNLQQTGTPATTNATQYHAERTKRGSLEDNTVEDETEHPDNTYPGQEKFIESLSTKYNTILKDEMGDYDKDATHPNFVVNVSEGSKPTYEKPRRIGLVETEKLYEQLQELIKKGYLIPSSSDYGAPVMMVPKPHQPDKYRLVCDYRRLNQVTIKDKYTIPNGEQLIGEMAGSKVFSVLDCLWGFWQCPTDPSTRHRTAISTPYGLYEWMTMPMGTTNSPPHFQRMMDTYLGHLSFVKVFVDDICIHSTSVEEHQQHLTQVFDILLKRGMIIKSSKMQLFKKSVKFLGHVLTGEGVAVQQSKVKAVNDWPTLANDQDVRRFLGLCNFYRKYVRNFADKAVPLTRLLRKDAVWQWTDTEQAAFQALKDSITQAPVLIQPDHAKAVSGEAPYIIQTDASGYALGGALMQVLNPDQGPQVIAFESRSLNPAEQNYQTTDRELLGLVHCTKAWRHWLQGATMQIQGDHKPLSFLFNPSKELSRRQARWIEHLIEVGVNGIDHVPGITIPVPDALSRQEHYPRYTPREGLDFAKVHPNAGDETDLKDRSFPFTFTAGSKYPDAQPIHVCNNLVLFATCDTVRTLHQSIQDLCCPLTTQPPTFAVPALTTEQERQRRLNFRRRRLNPYKWDNQDWKIVQPQFKYWTDRFGRFGPNNQFTVDACVDRRGQNAQVPRYWHSGDSCIATGSGGPGNNRKAKAQRWQGETVWCNPPFNDPEFIRELFETFLLARARNPQTSALFMIPRHYCKKILTDKYLKRNNLEIVHVYPPGVPLFESPDGHNPESLYEVAVIWGKPLVEPLATTPKKRREDELADTEVTLTNIRDRYNEDPELVALRTRLRATEHGQDNEFKLAGDLVWRLASGHYQLCVPRNTALLEAIFMQCHDAPSAGHLGLTKTADKILRRFWWHNMHGTGPHSIKSYLETCQTCQTTKPVQRRTRIVNPHKVPSRPYEVITIDFVTGLPTTAANHSAIMTITCQLTKMVTLVPLNWKASTAYDIHSLFMQNVWRLRGSPLKIICDNDTRFGKWYKQLQRLFGTRIATTVAYNPQSDGQSENTNKTVEVALTAYVNDSKDDWDNWLHTVEYAINDSVHMATGHTPFYACYGFHPSSNLDLLLDTLRSEVGVQEFTNPPGAPHPVKLADKIRATITDIKAKLQLALDKTLDAQDIAWDNTKNGTVPTYQIGDSVLLKLKNYIPISEYANQKKISPRWGGPFSILKVHYSDARKNNTDITAIPSAYTLELPSSWTIHPTFTPDNLKRFKTNDAWPSRYTAPPPPIVMVEGHEEHTVERVLRTRWVDTPQGCQQEWLILWAGHTIDKASWLNYEAINTGGQNDSWRKFQQAVLKNETKLRNRIKVLHGALQTMTIDRLNTFYSDYDPAALTPNQRQLFEATTQLVTHTNDANGRPQPTTLYDAHLRILLLGYNPTLQHVFNDILGDNAEIISVGPHHSCTHNTLVANWFRSHSSSPSKPELLCGLYPRLHFDLVWITPTELEKGGKRPEYTTQAILEPALHYLVQFEPTHFVIDRSPVSLSNSVCKSDYNISGFPDRVLPRRTPKYTIPGTLTTDNNLVWWTNIPLKLNTNHSATYADAVTTIMTAMLTNQFRVMDADG
jgi:hypothetical protein